MKGHILALIVVFLFYCNCEKVRYDEFKVLQIDVRNETDRTELLQLTEQYLVDIWASNAIEGWVHVMLTQEQLPLFQNRFLYKVHIDNVQEELDRSEAELSEKKGGFGAFFDNFPTTKEVNDWIDTQVSNHKTVARKVKIGNTFQSKEIFGIHLGDPTKRLIYIHCLIHAREWITTTSCCWIIDSLLNTDPEGPTLLKEFEWIIVPVLNVDGYDHTRNDRLWRKNLQTNRGSNCLGTDLNRNYEYKWATGGSSSSPCSDIYHGVSPFSAPEVNAEQAFLKPYTDAKDLLFFVDIHAYGGQFMSPWGWSTDIPPNYSKMDTLMRIVAAGIKTINNRNYATGTSARVIYIAAGGSDDYFYGTRNVVYSYTTEAYGTNFTPTVSLIPSIGRELYAGIKAGAKYLASQ